MYSDELFEWHNMATLPDHKLKPFGGLRAANSVDGLIGGYCVAQLRDGSYLVDHMAMADILEVWKASKASDGPWQKWPLEMIKKTLVKRASKSWPQSGGRTRIDAAIELINQHEGIEEAPVTARVSDYLQPTPEQTRTYMELAKGDTVDFWLWYRAQDERLKISLPGCKFEPRQKQKMMAIYNDALEDGRKRLEAWLIDLNSMCEQGDDYGVAEFLVQFDGEQRRALLDGLNIQARGFAEHALKELES